ncbi:MAG: nucleotidyltransferase family protein [Sphingobacteriales bacterium]|nr:nucleotidyltransferase family protein [Sphingobacteriales bacterium]
MSVLDSIRTTLQLIKPQLLARYHVTSVGIFGSVVRDDFSPLHSDIDIIVDFSRPIGIEFIDLADFIETRLKRKVDLVSRKGIKAKYFKEIEPDIIYV